MHALVILGLILFGVTLLWRLSRFFEIYSLFFSEPVEHRSNAVIYAAPRFHQEVISVLACAYKELGFKVTVYVNSGIFILGFMLPFSDTHLYKSKEHYGQCVDEWININTPDTKLVKNTATLIFGTYPLKIKGGGRDEFAFDLIRQFVQQQKQQSKQGPVLFVTHRSNEAINENTKYLESIIPRSKSIYMFLSNHTESTSRYQYFKSGSNYKSIHVYPVLPTHYVMDDNVYKTAINHPTFSVQGNFGGKHAHRKNTESVVNCVRQLEDLHPEQDYGLDFIGSGDLKLHSLKRGVLRHLSDLSHRDFYRAIAISKFLVPAIGEEDYFFSRATSSIPAALIAHVPLATSKTFLHLYPCLRDSHMHKLITQDTECETMMAASELDDEQYEQIKNEAIYCADKYWTELLETLKATQQSVKF